MEEKSKEILILIGIPASGKSTFAKEFIIDNPDYLRINRDDIRYMIKNKPLLEYDLEKLVTDIEFSNATMFLENGYNIIWDNTHVKLSYIKNIIDKF